MRQVGVTPRCVFPQKYLRNFDVFPLKQQQNLCMDDHLTMGWEKKL